MIFFKNCSFFCIFKSRLSFLFIKREENSKFEALDILKSCNFSGCSDATRSFFIKTLLPTLKNADDVKLIHSIIYKQDTSVENLEKSVFGNENSDKCLSEDYVLGKETIRRNPPQQKSSVAQKPIQKQCANQQAHAIAPTATVPRFVFGTKSQTVASNPFAAPPNPFTNPPKMPSVMILNQTTVKIATSLKRYNSFSKLHPIISVS